jgi:hypothetical protein
MPDDMRSWLADDDTVELAGAVHDAPAMVGKVVYVLRAQHRPAKWTRLISVNLSGERTVIDVSTDGTVVLTAMPPGRDWVSLDGFQFSIS